MGHKFIVYSDIVFGCRLSALVISWSIGSSTQTIACSTLFR